MNEFLIILFVASLQTARPEAAARAAEAYYKQSGTEQALNEWAEKNTSRELRATAGQISFVARTIFTQQITFKWGF